MSCISTLGFLERPVLGPGTSTFPPADDAKIVDPAQDAVEVSPGDENPPSPGDIEFEYGIIIA